MDQKVEDIIRKVRKLLAVGDQNRNNSEAEALTAMEFANKMMAEYNLSMDDVAVKEMKVEGVKEESAEKRRNCVPWERSLGTAIGRLFGTKAFRRQHGYSYSVSFSMCFIGVGADAQVSSAAYESLHESLERMGRNTGYRGCDKGSYLLGVAQRLIERATALHSAALIEQSTRGVCKDLMVVKDQLIKTYAEQTLMLTTCRQGRIGGSHSAYNQGKADGNSVNLPGRNQLE